MRPELTVEQFVDIVSAKINAHPVFLTTSVVYRVLSATWKPPKWGAPNGRNEYQLRQLGSSSMQFSWQTLEKDNESMIRLDDCFSPVGSPALAELWDLEAQIETKLDNLGSSIIAATMLVTGKEAPETLAQPTASASDLQINTIGDIVGIGYHNIFFFSESVWSLGLVKVVQCAFVVVVAVFRVFMVDVVDVFFVIHFFVVVVNDIRVVVIIFVEEFILVCGVVVGVVVGGVVIVVSGCHFGVFFVAAVVGK